MSGATAIEPPRLQLLREALTRTVRTWSSALLVAGVILLLVVVAPFFAPYGSEEVIQGKQLVGPSGDHLFGTDINQMDVFSRVLAGFRLDVGIAFAAAAASLALGFPLGILLGFFSGRLVTGALRLLDMVQAFPVLILALAIVVLAGNSVLNVILAGIFVATPIMIRVVRSVAVTLREERFVEAGVATGNSDSRLIVRHIAPHALPTALIEALIILSGTIILVTGLSFIGAGVRPPTAEWGSMVSLGSRDIVNGEWWTVVFPGLAIALSVFMFNLLGQLLRRQFGSHLH